MHTLRMEGGGQVATLVIDRPETHNAITQEMWEELTRLLAGSSSDPPQVLLVRSAVAGMFSSGADVQEYRANAGDVTWGLASQARVQAALTALRSFPAPTVAVIGGACVGGGAGIALACDFRLSGDRARFAIPPAKLGLVFPHRETAALVSLVGPARAKRILFTGQPFSASWALGAGFVDEVHTEAELEAAVDDLVAQLLAVAPGSVRAMKAVLAMIEADRPDAGAEAERLVAEALAGDEHKEGVAAFLERRTPEFSRPIAPRLPPPPRG